MFKFLTLLATSTILLSACNQATLLPQMTEPHHQIKTQGFIPPSDRPIKPRPCGMRTSAALPPGYQKPSPCTCKQSFQVKAALPPGYSPKPPGCTR